MKHRRSGTASHIGNGPGCDLVWTLEDGKLPRGSLREFPSSRGQINIPRLKEWSLIRFPNSSTLTCQSSMSLEARTRQGSLAGGLQEVQYSAVIKDLFHVCYIFREDVGGNMMCTKKVPAEQLKVI